MQRAPLSRQPGSASVGCMIACLDLEGVLTPEVWINVAERTGVEALRRTTRDEPDYDKLMQYRLEILDRERITLPQIQQVIAGMGPLPGAAQFLQWLKSKAQVIVLSDTFYQFAEPLMRQLDFPCLFCHWLQVDDQAGPAQPEFPCGGRR
jgi:phosphoserine/homoserine phosphotransferase